LENVRARAQVDESNEGLAERVANLNRAVANADDRIADIESDVERLGYLERVAADPKYLEPTDRPAVDRPRIEPQSEARAAALRTVEPHQDAIESGASDELERLIRGDGPGDWTSRYLSAVGSRAYRTAFVKLMRDPQHGHLRFSPEEVEAVRLASAVQAERAMAVGSGPAGGFAIPFTLDPSIVLTSGGALNPVRQLARVVIISTNE
jgi:HK97 family phage major capsid protein